MNRFLCEQIAGDMLCADQNFDIAQVIRFFKSKVRTVPVLTSLFTLTGLVCEQSASDCLRFLNKLS